MKDIYNHNPNLKSTAKNGWLFAKGETYFMWKMKCRDKCFLYTGIFLINLIVFPVLVSTLCFILGISVNECNFILAVLLNVVMILIVGRDNKKDTAYAMIAGITIALVVMYICGHTYDWSFDGNTYHKSMIGLLKNGWNPLRQTFYEFAEKFDFLDKVYETWYDAYPKGVEIWAACIYYIVGDIEVGKAYTLLSVIGVGLIIYVLIGEIEILRDRERCLLTLMSVLNPVVISQCFTYYVDAFMWEMLLLFIVALLYISATRDQKYESHCLYLIFISIVIGFNIKFSAIIFWGIFGIVMFGYWLFEYKKRNIGKRKLVTRFIVLSISVVVGTVFVGSTSYVVNIIRHQNPFYTMIGEGKSEMIVSQLPPVYRTMSNIQRFMVSLFSRTSNSLVLEQVDWKLPLSIQKSELEDAILYDCRTAGWGILFSAILILSVAIIVAFYFTRNNKLLKRICFYLIGVTVGLVIIVPGMNWARYSIVIFLFPVMAVLCCLVILRGGTTRNYIYHCGMMAIIVLSLLNCLPNLKKDLEVVKDFLPQEKELIEMKRMSDKQVVYVDENIPYYGVYFNYLDKDIDNLQSANIENESNIQVTFSSSLWIRYATRME